MGKGCLAVIAVVVVLALVAGFVGISYVSTQHQLVSKDEAVKSAWSNVDADLQRRADLIPNLVETVKGYAKQETTVFGDIANARAGLLNSHTPQEKIAANNTLDGAFGRLLALTENYPQLKSNEQFMRLQDTIAGTENRIKASRTRYNSTLRDYNTFVRSFPNSIWAGMLGFQAHEDAYFEASAASRNAPSVKF